MVVSNSSNDVFHPLNLRHSQISERLRTLTMLRKCSSETSVYLPALSPSFTFRLPWHICERSKYKKRIEWNVGLGCSNIGKFVIWSVFIRMLVLGAHFSLGFPDSELPPTIYHQCLLFINIISSSLRFPLPILWSLRVSTCLPSWQNLTVPFRECTLKALSLTGAKCNEINLKNVEKRVWRARRSHNSHSD
jgi:hypothetical protein